MYTQVMVSHKSVRLKFLLAIYFDYLKFILILKPILYSTFFWLFKTLLHFKMGQLYQKVPNKDRTHVKYLSLGDSIYPYGRCQAKVQRLLSHTVQSSFNFATKVHVKMRYTKNHTVLVLDALSHYKAQFNHESKNVK